MALIGTWLTALEATAPAGLLRGSVWAYPLINAGHILGIALLVGAIVPLDLRLLGLWPSVPLGPLWQVLPRTAAVGLALAVVTGVLLFITRATAYAVSGLFLAKMAVVAAGAVNALLLHRLMNDKLLLSSAISRPPIWVRASALASLSAWLTALTLGRLVGYF